MCVRVPEGMLEAQGGEEWLAREPGRDSESVCREMEWFRASRLNGA